MELKTGFEGRQFLVYQLLYFPSFRHFSVIALSVRKVYLFLYTQLNSLSTFSSSVLLWINALAREPCTLTLLEVI